MFHKNSPEYLFFFYDFLLVNFKRNLNSIQAYAQRKVFNIIPY